MIRRPLSAVFALLALLACAAAHAAATRGKTCLVLGGGGARGAAHIGVLKVLEREHVPIDCIAGTSMGAIVGGLYAAGYSADEIEALLRDIDWRDMFKDDPPRTQLPMRRKEDELRFLGGVELGYRDGKIALPRGVIQGQKLELLLRRLLLSTLDTADFDRLPIPFRSVATDIARGERVVFAQGDLAMAIRASMSVPAAFAPIHYAGHLLVDGGITDNVPIDVARDLGATRLIVVDVAEPLSGEDKLDSPFALANQMLIALMKQHSDAQLATLGADDLLLAPQLGDLTSAEFDRAAEAIARGQASAEAALAQVRAFAADDARYAQFTAQHRLRRFDPPLIAFLDVLHDRSRSAGQVAQRLSEVTGKALDPARVEKDIGLAYGEGSYERIGYELEHRDGETGLRVLPIDKSWGPNFLRLGLRLSDNFNGRNSYQLFGEANFTGLNDAGGQSRNRVQLGQTTELYSEFLQPFGGRGEFYVAPYLQYKAYNFPLGTNGAVDFAEYRHKRALGAFETGWTPGADWQLSAALEYGRDGANLRIGPPQFPNAASHFGGVVLRAVYDDLDQSGFPTRGTRVDAAQEVLLTELGSSQAARISRLAWDSVVSSGANHWLLGGFVASAAGSGRAAQLAAYSPIGGLTNLSGYTENQVFATQTALLRAVYYRRLTDAQSLFAVPVYLGGSVEAGGAWDTRRRIGSDPIGAGSVFLGVDTLLGPIFFGYGYAQGGHNALYLTFGSLLHGEP